MRIALVLALAACSSSMPSHSGDDDGTTCGDGQVLDPATNTCVATCNPTGIQHAQPLAVAGATRHYMLYVPTTYRCGTPSPLVIDFHGTWSGNETDNGEEFYALDGMIAEAEAEGFIVARPRSLSSPEGGSNVYRWDQNPGDLENNAAFAHALVTHLSALYTVDAARVYASGFSSGTNMAAQFFADDPQAFHGYAFVGGGVFDGEAPASVHLDAAPRIYAVSGYRDYLYLNQQDLFTLLDAHGFPRDHVFQRTDMNGHELYGWHYRELFDWLDKATRPAAGTLAAGWTREATSTTEDLTALAGDGGGGLLATGGAGGIYRRDPTAGWSRVTTVTGAPGLASVCVLPSGVGIAVGESRVVHTIDHGATWQTDVSIPAFVPGFFDVPFLNAVGCSASQLVTVGYWDSASSTTGTTWTETDTPNMGFPAQGAQVKASTAGTWLASGYYDYIGRSSDGITFENIASPVGVQWLMGIASAPGGTWWIAGEAGTIIASADDGKTWTDQSVQTEDDLYAIGFFDAQRGLAVGTHGAAYLTVDGGAHWTERSTGLDGFLGDVVWLDGHTALAIGGNGSALALHVD
jgi:photosystem II stability/assembly factor-like uncharacterized protein/predicted esterase